jgi:hypothetical protein
MKRAIGCRAGIATLVIAFCLVAIAPVSALIPPPIIDVQVVSGGGVKIYGEHFIKAEALRSKLVEMKHWDPVPDLQLQFDDAATPEDVGAAVILLRKAGGELTILCCESPS